MADRSKLSLAKRRRTTPAEASPPVQELDESIIPNTPDQQQDPLEDSDVTVDENASQPAGPSSPVLQTPLPVEPSTSRPARPALHCDSSSTPNDDVQTEVEGIPKVPVPQFLEMATDYDSGPPPFTVMGLREAKAAAARDPVSSDSEPFGTERLNKRLAKVLEGKKPPSPSANDTNFSILGYFRKCLSKYHDNLQQEIAKEAEKEKSKIKNLERINANRGELRPWRRFKTRAGLSYGSETQATLRGPHDASDISTSDLLPNKVQPSAETVIPSKSPAKDNSSSNEGVGLHLVEDGSYESPPLSLVPPKRAKPSVGKGVPAKGKGKGKATSVPIDYEVIAAQYKAAFWKQKAANATKEGKLLDEQLNVELMRQRALTKEYKLDD